MGAKLGVADLAQIPLFSQEETAVLEALLEKGEERWLQPGDVLLQPGENNERLALILDGELSIELEVGGNVVISTLGRGDCVGELSVLDGKEVTAYVIATRHTRLLLLGRQVISGLIDTSHSFARKLLYTLSSRIRQDNDNLTASIRRQLDTERFARIDVLTNLNNRRWLDEMLPRLMERCKIAREPFGLLMLDIDHFKHYNDTHGHLAGDEALRVVGRTLLANLRANDAAARYGGEEFIVLLPNMPGSELKQVAERLLVELHNQPIVRESGESLPSITASIGVASMVGGEPADSLIAAADGALYRAKSDGRNRVALAQR